jgi:acylpyruvate hydrolase
MKIVVFGPEKRTGVLRDGKVVDIERASAKYLGEKKGERNARELAAAVAPADLGRFIEGGKRALETTEAALDHLLSGREGETGLRGERLIHDLASVKLHAPRAAGARVACAGGNFADHTAAMAERAAKRGEMRAFSGDVTAEIRKMGIWGFWKVDRESVAHDGEIAYPARATRLDYEGELAVVLGKEGRDIRAGDIKDYVWGVTLVGDWSIRQSAEPGPLKFAMQKNFDGSCSIGPCIAVGEADPFDAMVETWVNGERRQRFSTRDMVFSFGEYLEHLSRDFTFFPGDIISGGTAAGTAADSSPLLADGTASDEKFLHAGDVVEIKSPAVGTLRNRIVQKRN